MYILTSASISAAEINCVTVCYCLPSYLYTSLHIAATDIIIMTIYTFYIPVRADESTNRQHGTSVLAVFC